MALTSEQVSALNALFPFDQHEFTRGFVYIREDAICDRLDAIDPEWLFVLKSLQVRDTDVVAVGSLTVGGVTREGVGMAKIMENAGEAEKSAATDALKRAARLFGVGRYLLNAPKEAQFKGWLIGLQKQNGNAHHLADAPSEPPAKPAPEPPAANGWTRDQANSLVTEAHNKGVTTDQLLAALQVEKISDYTPGFSAARETLAKAAKAIKETNAQPAPDGMFGGAK